MAKGFLNSILPRKKGGKRKKAVNPVIVRRLIKEYVKPYTGRVLLGMSCMLLTAVCMGIFVHLIQPLIDKTLDPDNQSAIWILPVSIVGLFFVKAIAEYVKSYSMEWVSNNLMADMQRKLYANLLRQDTAFFLKETAAGLTARFTFDLQRMRQGLGNLITSSTRDFATIIAMVANLLHKDWRLALMSFTILPLVLFPIRRIGKHMRRYSRKMQEDSGVMASALNEGFASHKLIKAYTMEEREQERANSLIDRVRDMLVKAGSVRAITSPVVEFIGMCTFAAIIFYAAQQVRSGDLTAGAFTSFITALLLVYRPIKGIANLNNILQETVAAAERAFVLLDTTPTIVDAKNAKPLKVKKAEVSFDNINFAYPDGTMAIKDINLTIPAGKTVAVVGPSGSGKSTLLNLLPRFFDPTSGKVLIDGQDIKNVTMHSLRQHISLVSQETALLNDTIAANIGYGRPGAEQADIEAAAKNAGAHGFITEQEKGYDTLVGENGANLSGGQRQRIAIARALLHNAPILLLDEATSSLDTKTERDVQDAIDTLAKNRTTFIIAHRLSTIASADMIYVLDAGRIVENGNHADLLAQKGAYAELWRLQGGEG